jgi:hypothetical protein
MQLNELIQRRPGQERGGVRGRGLCLVISQHYWTTFLTILTIKSDYKYLDIVYTFVPPGCFFTFAFALLQVSHLESIAYPPASICR